MSADLKARLWILWLFVSLNYLYGSAFESLESIMVTNLTWVFLLVFAILLETPFAMVVLSRILEYRVNRLANILLGVVNVFTSLFFLVVGFGAWPLHPNQPLSEIMAIGALSLIIWYAWKWPKP